MSNFIKDEIFSILLGGKCTRTWGLCLLGLLSPLMRWEGKQNTGGNATLTPMFVGPGGLSTQLTFSWSLCAFYPFFHQQPPIPSPWCVQCLLLWKVHLKCITCAERQSSHIVSSVTHFHKTNTLYDHPPDKELERHEGPRSPPSPVTT